MEVTRRRAYHINTGQFEFVETSAEVTVTIDPAIIASGKFRPLYDQIDNALDLALTEDLQAIYALNGNKLSLIEEHPLVKRKTTE